MGTKSARPREPRKRSTAALRTRTGLAGALFTRTQQKVLGLLFTQPTRSFYANEIIDLTAAGSGAVQRELAKLVKSGLLTVESLGRQTHYRANSNAPIYEELRSIVLKTVGLADPLRNALEPLRSRIRSAVLYGSVVTGADRADSDIDLLLIADRLTLEEAFAKLNPVEQQLGRKINTTIYTSAEYKSRIGSGNPFLSKVLAGAHIELIKDDHGASATR